MGGPSFHHREVIGTRILLLFKSAVVDLFKWDLIRRNKIIICYSIKSYIFNIDQSQPLRYCTRNTSVLFICGDVMMAVVNVVHEYEDCDHTDLSPALCWRSPTGPTKFDTIVQSSCRLPKEIGTAMFTYETTVSEQWRRVNNGEERSGDAALSAWSRSAAAAAAAACPPGHRPKYWSRPTASIGTGFKDE